MGSMIEHIHDQEERQRDREAAGKIWIGDDAALPIDAVTETFAYLARRGGGKTYGASKLCEGFLDVGAQVVVLDPVGRWYGLRLRPDGETPSGYNIVVMGGTRGDIPLEPTAGALVADAVVDHGMSVILDVSMFESEAQKKRFVADFCEQLLKRKKQQSSPMHLFVEEAQEFCPQRVTGAEARMVGAVERIVKLGRNFGIGCTLISQRPQAVNKDALNLTGCLVVLQTTGPQERKTLEGWITDKGDGDVKALLSKVGHLQKGEAFLWAPQGFPPDQQAIFRQIKIGQKKTYDASRTPRLSDGVRAVVGLPGIDLGALARAMAATVEKVKASDPAELRRQLHAQAAASAKIVEAANMEVRRLTAEQNAARMSASRDLDNCVTVLRKWEMSDELTPSGWFDMPRVLGQLCELVKLSNPDVSAALSKAAEGAPHTLAEAMRRISALESSQRPILRWPPEIDSTQRVGSPSADHPSGARIYDPDPSAPRGTKMNPLRSTSEITPEIIRNLQSQPHMTLPDGVKLLAGQIAMLRALASWPDGTLSRHGLGVTSGFNHNGGGFRNYLSELTALGLITTVSGGGMAEVRLTPRGRAIFPQAPEITREQLVALWSAKLTGKARVMLEILVALGPDHPGLLRHEIAASVEMDATGGGFRNYVSDLTRPGIVVERRAKRLIAAPWFHNRRDYV